MSPNPSSSRSKVPNYKKIKAEFERIKSLGFVPSRRSSSTGVGKTFEDYLGVLENNRKDPDFESFEVKSKRELASSRVTLFTLSPSHPKDANSYLRSTYGRPDTKYPHIPVLHVSFFTTRSCNYNNKFTFQLINDMKQGRFLIDIFDTVTLKHDKSVYYKHSVMRERFNNKLRHLFFVNAQSKKIKGKECFNYTSAVVYTNGSFETFIDMFNKGVIQFDLRLGVYKTGRLAGKKHDHGSGFRIKKQNFADLYSNKFDL